MMQTDYGYNPNVSVTYQKTNYSTSSGDPAYGYKKSGSFNNVADGGQDYGYQSHTISHSGHHAGAINGDVISYDAQYPSHNTFSHRTKTNYSNYDDDEPVAVTRERYVQEYPSELGEVLHSHQMYGDNTSSSGQRVVHTETKRHVESNHGHQYDDGDFNMNTSDRFAYASDPRQLETVQTSYKYSAEPRSPSLHSAGSRHHPYSGTLTVQSEHIDNQDPYVNLPAAQTSYQTGYVVQSAIKQGSMSNLSAGGRSPGYRAVNGSQGSLHMQTNFEQQNEYVNYRDPDVRAAQESLQDLRIHGNGSMGSLPRANKFGTLSASGGGQYNGGGGQYNGGGGGGIGIDIQDVAVQERRIHQESYEQQQTKRTEQRKQTVQQEVIGSGFRDPDMADLIEYLRSGDVTTQANAAAYIQHITYLEDATKTRVRTLGGIQPLVRLLATENTELLRNVLGALRNLSFGRAQEENKKEIYRCGALQEINQILISSRDQESRELATAVLWNLSSSADLKRPVIDICLDTLVRHILLVHAGLELRGDSYVNIQREIYWTTVFRNASGVIRSVSSDGEYARRRLRFADGLVESLLQILRCAIENNDWDNKAVENCVCTIRNLTYACQEVEDPKYLEKRANKKNGPEKNSPVGCFSKKGKGNNKKPETQSTAPVIQRKVTNPVRGMDLLWALDIIPLLLPLVADCTNPETLEAAAGAIQNLSACDWQPSIDIRAHVRKEKGLPLLVELLSLDADKVVQVAATALRNLAQDDRNKELIGKYALETLTTRLPKQDDPQSMACSSDTHVAVLATIYTVVKDNTQFAGLLLDFGGVHRCMYISSNPVRFTSKLVKYSNTLLYVLWQMKELHVRYTEKGLSESDFLRKGTAGQKANISTTDQSQSGPSLRQNTMPKDKMVHRERTSIAAQGYDNSAYERTSGVPPDHIVLQSRQQPQEPVYAQVDRNRGQGGPEPAADSWV